MDNKEILQGILNKNEKLLSDETKYMLKFEEVIDDLVTLCSSEIMRYSMQNFMEGFSKEQRHIIAMTIARNSYNQATLEIEKYFKS